jgi:tetratricopeptide (TPR) repeat protein
MSRDILYTGRCSHLGERGMTHRWNRFYVGITLAAAAALLASGFPQQPSKAQQSAKPKPAPAPAKPAAKPADPAPAGGPPQLLKPGESTEERQDPFGQEAFVIEYFHNTARFESDGTGTRQARVRVKVQNEAGVQQLGQLAIGYNSGNEKLEVDYVRVRKADGQVVSAGADAVQDLSAPIEREAPVYTDFRQKHITVPALRPGEILEYQMTTHVHTPLAAGHFWLEHNFIEDAIVLEETLTVSVPASREVKLKNHADRVPAIEDNDGRRNYVWASRNLKRPGADDDQDPRPKKKKRKKPESPHVQLTTFQSWEGVGRWYAALEGERVAPSAAIRAKAEELTKGLTTDAEKIEALYDFVAKNFRYVSLSFGLGRYQPHAAAEVLTNQYGDCKDKHTLLASLLDAAGLEAQPVLINSRRKIDADMPSPSQFDHVITAVPVDGELLWMDTTTEVAPFRLLSASLRKKQALLAARSGGRAGAPRLVETPADPPFAASQVVEVEGKVSELGKLDAKVRYTLRGDNELGLRIAFRRTPQSQWKQIGQMMSSSDGVGGQVTEIKGSDPAATREPFTIEFQMSQPNFLDWSKKRSQLALPIPGVGLPWADEDAEEGDDPVELGSPLAVTARLKLELPAKYAARAPIPVAISRDYAEYRSSYKVEGQTVTAERTARFKLREIAPTRARDFLAFSRAVRSDEAQAVGIESTLAGAPTIPETAKADELYQSGVAALRSDNYALAVELFQRVLVLEPKHKQAWQAIGIAHLSQRDWTRAAGAFQKQIEANPYDETAHRLLGSVYLQEQKYAEAVAAFQKQLEVKPLDKFAQAQLGMAYREWRKFEEAATELEKAVILDPDDANLQVNLGQTYLNLKQPEKAVAAFDKAVELAPSPTTWNNVAYELSLHRAHLERALQYAESAVAAVSAELRNVALARVTLDDMRRVSSLASYWDTLGWVHFQNGNLDHAEKYVRASWLLDFHGEVGDHLGQIHEKRGNKAAALDFYSAALAASRPHHETRARLAALAGGDDQVARLVDQGRERLAAARTVRLGPLVKEDATADFFLLFTVSAAGDSVVEEAKFIAGSEKLRPFASALRSARYDVHFPADHQTRVVRRGTLSCSAAKGCAFTLLAADAVTSIN